MKTDKKRVEFKWPRDLVADIDAVADDHFNGNRSLAAQKMCEKEIARTKKGKR